MALPAISRERIHSVRRTDKFWAGLWTDLTTEQTIMRSIKNLGLARVRGMDESTRNIQISTLHHCTAIKQSMQNITKTVRQTSAQDVKLGRSQRLKDNQDLQKLYSWFQQFNIFDSRDCRLQLLKSGLVAKESHGINCHQAEVIGQQIKLGMDNKMATEAKVETSKKVKTLITLTKVIKQATKPYTLIPQYYFSDLSSWLRELKIL